MSCCFGEFVSANESAPASFTASAVVLSLHGHHLDEVRIQADVKRRLVRSGWSCSRAILEGSRDYRMLCSKPPDYVCSDAQSVTRGGPSIPLTQLRLEAANDRRVPCLS